MGRNASQDSRKRRATERYKATVSQSQSRQAPTPDSDTRLRAPQLEQMRHLCWTTEVIVGNPLKSKRMTKDAGSLVRQPAKTPTRPAIGATVRLAPPSPASLSKAAQTGSPRRTAKRPGSETRRQRSEKALAVATTTMPAPWGTPYQGAPIASICKKNGSTSWSRVASGSRRTWEGLRPKQARKWREKWAVSANPHCSPISVTLRSV